MAMYHCPAFDYNIIKADILISEVKTKYDKFLRLCNVRYNPPDNIHISFSFETESSHKIILIEIYWKSKFKDDLFTISDNPWTVSIHMDIECSGYETAYGITGTNEHQSSDDILKLIGECLG